MDKVLVIIVTYNAHDWIHQCLNSVDMERYDAFVVDNASTDDTRHILKTEYPKAIVRLMDKNLGFGQANNIGLRYALDNGYDYVFLLNQDAWLLPDTIDKLIATQKQHPEYWVLSPLQRHTQRGGLERYFEYLCKKNKVNINSGKLEHIKFVNAALWLLPIRTIQVVGGFDSLFPHYGEDNDYICRVHYWEGNVGVCTKSVAYHEHVWTNKAFTFEQQLYRKKIGYLGLWKDINRSQFFGKLICLFTLYRKTAKCLFKKDYFEIRLCWLAWLDVTKQKEQIKRQRELSKNQQAFL